MIPKQNFRIERDNWGVPHIWGKTDADAAYGLSWARGEDNFNGMQEAFMIIRGRQAEITGIKGIGSDVLVFLIQADKIVVEEWGQAISSEFKKILLGSINGINDYANKHLESIKYKNLFPITEIDVLKGYILSQTFTSGAIYSLGKVAGDKMDRIPEGSNAFAIRGSRMKDGKTLLISNVHQPLEGPWAFYEAHLCSDEGWNILGATYFPFVTPLFGTTPDLAWTPTNNYANFSSTYQLELHPKNKMKYRMDDDWLTLKPLVFKTRVKLGPIYIPIRKKYYWSKYGITIKNKSGCFAIRFSARFAIKAAEQIYWMSKAKNLKEFKAALQMQGLASQNLIYADRQDNIFLISNGLFPFRNPKFGERKILPGNTSQSFWKPEFHPVKDLPQIENPNCGILYNTNNPPFIATEARENLDPQDYDPTFDFVTLESNRGLRFKEILKSVGNKQIDLSEAKSWKYDLQFAQSSFYSFVIENLDELLDLSLMKYPDVQKSIDVINNWNRKSDIDNEQAGVFAVLLHYMVNYIDTNFLRGQANRIPVEVFVSCLRKTQKTLLKNFGKLEVPLRKIQFLMRGDREIPMPGLPENIAAIFIKEQQKGKFKIVGGDSYIQIVQFTSNDVNVESIVPYGASEHPESPHYDDQIELFAAGQLKKMNLKYFESEKDAKNQH